MSSFRVAIGSACLPVSSGDPKKLYSEGEFAYIDIASIDQEAKKLRDTKRLAVLDAPSRARQRIRPGDILVSTVRPNLNAVAEIPQDLDDAIASTGFCVLRPDPTTLLSRYLFHWVKTAPFINEMVRHATGASYPAVTDGIVKSALMPLPPLDEQRRIAAILDQAEELRAKRRAAIALLDQLPQAIFLEMFGDPSTNTRMWPVERLGDVCDVRDGTHDSPRYVSGPGFPLVTSKNVSNGRIDLLTASLISEEDFHQINKRSKVDRGDLIMPMIGTIGSPVLVEDDPRFAIKNLALVKFHERSPNRVYVHRLLASPYFEYIMARKNRGGTQKFVSLGDLRSLLIPLPPFDLQLAFAVRSEAIRRTKAAHQSALAELDTLFVSLQSTSFAGVST